MKPLCIGFFDRGNFGDQLFSWLYKKCFPEFTIASIETVSPLVIRKHTCLLLAGGDILNDYFMSKLVNLLEQANFTGPVYAFSAGIPYKVKPVNLSITMKLFNGIMVRSQRDYTWTKSIQESHVTYHPDVSIFTEELLDKETIDVTTLLPSTAVDRKRVILTVAQPFYASCTSQEEFLGSLVGIVEELVHKHNAHVFMIPFNTFKSNKKECDLYLQDDLVKSLSSDTVTHVSNVTRDFTMEEMFAIFKSMDLGVHMRYHAHMFSVISGLPFVSLGLTPKTINLCADIGISDDYMWYQPDLTAFILKNVPTEQSASQQRNMFKQYMSGYTLENYKNTVYDWITSSNGKTSRCPLYKTVMEVVTYLRHQQPKIDYSNNAWVQRILTEAGSIGKMIRSYSIPVDAGFLAALVCYHLIGSPFPDYHYGLTEKILSPTFMASRELQWIYNDFNTRSAPTDSHYMFQQSLTYMSGRPRNASRQLTLNLTHVNANDFNGLHRSGWPFVMSSLAHLHDSSAPLIFDNYVDRTFHWCHDIYRYVGIIPYTKPWIGVIHHTMDTLYSDFNTTKLLEQETFKESLVHCAGLIVLSDYLKTSLEKHIDVPIVSIKHPTDLTITRRFEMSNFLQEPSIVQVGAWLRENYSIYALTPAMPWLKKKVLRGKNMNHHFCPPEFELSIDNSRLDITNQLASLTVSCSTNKFVSGMLKHLHQQYNSVEEISTLPNDGYDILLSKNIVFLNLVDASAVNTVIECIARATPIVINRHPAVVEYLGADYPLLYDSIAHANTLVCDIDKIQQAHDYLREMYKGDLGSDHFVYQLTKFVQSLLDTPATS